ncbi:MAG: bifunctional hydroxymethylpyrimidine kinase/phosphomethylpyrimidine kinase, partial [Myxococcales bacterium]|nr:bifunctional hydroxymethylpyrimidine kinase/phosphomethylpyrimidine kinase [Myxococcales bacterium]
MVPTHLEVALPPRALTIAGSDPSGGAGLQADLKTFHGHGVVGAAVPTLLTVQNGRGVREFRLLDGPFVRAQIEALLEDDPPRAIKLGALGSASIVAAIADALDSFEGSLVVDPVFRSTSGAELLDAAGRRLLEERLLPRVSLFTPNLDEAALLLGAPIAGLDAAREAALRLAARGPGAVLLTGGHLEGAPIDCLAQAGQVIELRSRRVPTRHTHGTGCALSAAITAHLAHGRDLVEAATRAKRWLTAALGSA